MKKAFTKEDSRNKIVILYVDDEQNNLNAFSAYFRRNKRYIILTANSAEEGLQILKVVSAHIIVADQKISYMTGVEFLEETKQKPEPIKIVVTAHRDISAIEKAYEEGKIFKYHDKPWNVETMEKSIEEAYKLFCERNL